MHPIVPRPASENLGSDLHPGFPPIETRPIVKAALECEKLRGEGSRNSLIRLLTFASSVDYIADTERHVAELVRACAKSPRGFEELLEFLLPCADTEPLLEALQESEMAKVPRTWHEVT